jgi:hypothetical protein
MPNHVTTICTVTGPEDQVNAFREIHITASEPDGDRFCFRTIIPRPAIIDETESGSEATIGVMALVGDVATVDFRSFRWIPSDVLSGPGYRHAKAVRCWLAENRPGALEKGRKCLQAIVETGYADWHEWACANWGTKWNAYDYEERERSEGRFVFKFETAWSFPEPVFRKLAEMYPGLTFDVLSYDEGGWFGCVGESLVRGPARTMRERPSPRCATSELGSLLTTSKGGSKGRAGGILSSRSRWRTRHERGARSLQCDPVLAQPRAG